MFQFLSRLFGRAPKNQLPPFDFGRNRFKAKKQWPPNLSALTEKQQFRFERKFKRRLLIKGQRPTWTKWIKITQWSTISFIMIWGIFFHEWSEGPMRPPGGEQPFSTIRSWTKGAFGGFWTHNGTPYERPRGLARPVGPGAGIGNTEEDGKTEGAAPVSESRQRAART